MPPRISRVGIAVLASTALAVAAASPALGGQPGQTVRIASEIILRPNEPAFHGRVKADKQACVRQRTVKMFQRLPNGKRKLLGTDLTNRRGKWEVIVDPLKKGDYFAVVTKRTEGTAGTTFVCKRDKSVVAHIVK